jgi:hypothetical protein
MQFRIACSLVIASIWAAAGAAAEPEAPDFERDIRPLLNSRCVKCHGPLQPKGDLNLSTLRGLARGGESGVAVVPGKPDESVFWQRLASDEMPPKDPLNAKDKTTFRKWIESGAAGLPQGEIPEPIALDHWAFLPLVRPAEPTVRDAARVRNAVDRLVQARLEQKKASLGLGPDADPRTLVRRVSLDVTGLPPTPVEVEAFVNDDTPDAYERMVDRYLASPSFGERWGKHWLDAAGYADSNGYFSADTDRPLAYRYRDYVMASFNADKPFDRFLRQQLAGDELAQFRPGTATTPEVIELLIATHFLRNGQDGTDIGSL